MGLAGPSGETQPRPGARVLGAEAAGPDVRRAGVGEGQVFACALADRFHEAGREIAHAVIAGPVVMDTALPPAVRMLLQNLHNRKAWRGGRSLAGPGPGRGDGNHR